MQHGNPFLPNSKVINDPNWYDDSGATKHVTANYANLADPTEYESNELVIVGNSSQLKISSIGNSTISDGKYLLNLIDILYVPKIIKNLVSVSKLTQDNNIYFEFHHRYCLIKDKGLGRVLLKGTLKEGLYHLEEFNAKEVGLSVEEKKVVNINKEHPSAFVLSNISVNSAISKSVWHK